MLHIIITKYYTKKSPNTSLFTGECRNADNDLLSVKRGLDSKGLTDEIFKIFTEANWVFSHRHCWTMRRMFSPLTNDHSFIKTGHSVTFTIYCSVLFVILGNIRVKGED